MKLNWYATFCVIKDDVKPQYLPVSSNWNRETHSTVNNIEWMDNSLRKNTADFNHDFCLLVCCLKLFAYISIANFWHVCHSWIDKLEGTCWVTECCQLWKVASFCNLSTNFLLKLSLQKSLLVLWRYKILTSV